MSPTELIRRLQQSAGPFRALLRNALRMQRATVQRQILNRLMIDLTPWNAVLSDSAETVLGQIAGASFRDILRSRLRGEPLAARPASMFAMEVPEVREFIHNMAINFAVTVNQTSTQHAVEAQQHFRNELATGLERGEIHAGLTTRLDRIFQNPARTSMIAHNEASRAMHGGEILAAKRFNEPMTKRWLASSDACPLCLKLNELDDRPLDEPFYVHPKGGPYAVVMHPPAHPNCFCSQTMDVL